MCINFHIGLSFARRDTFKNVWIFTKKKCWKINFCPVVTRAVQQSCLFSAWEKICPLWGLLIIRKKCESRRKLTLGFSFGEWGLFGMFWLLKSKVKNQEVGQSPLHNVFSKGLIKVLWWALPFSIQCNIPQNSLEFLGNVVSWGLSDARCSVLGLPRPNTLR